MCARAEWSATKTFDDAGCCLLAAYLIILLLHSNSHIRGLHTLYRASPQRGDPPKRYRSHDHRHTHILIHEHTNEGYQTIHTTSEEDHAPRVTVLANAALSVCVFFAFVGLRTDSTCPSARPLVRVFLADYGFSRHFSRMLAHRTREKPAIITTAVCCARCKHTLSLSFSLFFSVYCNGHSSNSSSSSRTTTQHHHQRAKKPNGAWASRTQHKKHVRTVRVTIPE